MHRLIGNVRPQKLSDPPSDKLFVSDPLHRLKHQRMMGKDQIRTLQKCLVYRIVINIDRDENLLYFLICPAENQPLLSQPMAYASGAACSSRLRISFTFILFLLLMISGGRPLQALLFLCQLPDTSFSSSPKVCSLCQAIQNPPLLLYLSF